MALDSYSGIPELSGEANAIARRRKIAEMMMAQSQEQLPVNQMAGQVVAPVSWTQGLAKLANAYLGKKQADEADKSEQGLANKRQQLVAEELNKVRKIAEGIPGVEGIVAQPERTIQAPAPMQPNQVAPNYGTVPETVPAVAGREAVPAVAGDKRKAIMEAVMSNLPEVQKYAGALSSFEEMDTKAADAKLARKEKFENDRSLALEKIDEQFKKNMISQEQAESFKMAVANMRDDTSRTIADNSNAMRLLLGQIASADRRYGVDNRAGSSTGGKPMTEQQRVKFEQGMAKDYKNAEQTMQTMAEIENSITTLKGSKGLSAREGYRGYLPAQIQGKNAMTAENRLQTLKGKVTQMGKAMATMSGAIGPMAVQEWKIVSDAVNAIDPTAGNLDEQLGNIEAQARGASSRVKDIYERTYGDNFESSPQFNSSNFKVYPSNTNQDKSGGIKPASGGVVEYVRDANGKLRPK